MPAMMHGRIPSMPAMMHGGTPTRTAGTCTEGHLHAQQGHLSAQSGRLTPWDTSLRRVAVSHPRRDTSLRRVAVSPTGGHLSAQSSLLTPTGRHLSAQSLSPCLFLTFGLKVTLLSPFLYFLD